MKKYLYTIGIALFAALSSCTDSLHDDIPTLGGADEYAVSISVELVQNDPRLNFEGNYSNGIKTKFETGDKLYLYKNGTKVPNIVFEYIKPSSQENVGIFGLVGSPDTKPLESGSFKAVLVGKNAKILSQNGNVLEELSELPNSLSEVLTNTSSEGTQKDNNNLADIEVGAGVFKSTNEIKFITNNSSHPGKLWGSDYFKFAPNYSIIELTLNEPIISDDMPNKADELAIVKNFRPKTISFGITFEGGKKSSFKLNVNEGQYGNNGNITWKSTVYIPIVDRDTKKIEQITIVALNNANPENSQLGSLRSYWQMGKPKKDDLNYTAGNVYEMQSALKGEALYLGYINGLDPNKTKAKEYVELIQNAPEGAIFTILDGVEYEGSEGKPGENTPSDYKDKGKYIDGGSYYVEITTFNSTLRENISKANGSIGLIFPYLHDFKGSIVVESVSGESRLTRAPFYNVKNLYFMAALNCLSISGGTFSYCENLRYVYAPNTKSISYLAFASCKQLENFVADDLIYIGFRAFSNCVKLKDANFKKATRVGYDAFAGCISLTNAQLDNVTSVGQGAFANCGKLEKFYAPKLYKINSYLFAVNTILTQAGSEFYGGIVQYPEDQKYSDIDITIGTKVDPVEIRDRVNMWQPAMFWGRFNEDNKPNKLVTTTGSNKGITTQMWDGSAEGYRLFNKNAGNIKLTIGKAYFDGGNIPGDNRSYVYVTNTNSTPDKNNSITELGEYSDVILWTQGRDKVETKIPLNKDQETSYYLPVTYGNIKKLIIVKNEKP